MAHTGSNFSQMTKMSMSENSVDVNYIEKNVRICTAGKIEKKGGLGDGVEGLRSKWGLGVDGNVLEEESLSKVDTQSYTRPEPVSSKKKKGGRGDIQDIDWRGTPRRAKRDSDRSTEGSRKKRGSVSGKKSNQSLSKSIGYNNLNQPGSPKRFPPPSHSPKHKTPNNNRRGIDAQSKKNPPIDSKAQTLAHIQEPGQA